MNKYVIASGGTGIMCVRSLIFMLAARYINPQKEMDGKVYIRLVDMDKGSDAKKECVDLIERYERLRRCVNRGADGGMKLPQIVLESWDFTDAVRRCADHNRVRLDPQSPITLRKLFETDGQPLDAHTDRLMKTFFTAAEMDEELDKGFYGHPNIGAMVFNYVRDDFLQAEIRTVDEATKQDVVIPSAFMTELKNDLRRATAQEKVPLYLYGSLFGGTGASVIPNLIDVLQSIPAEGTAPLNGAPAQPWGTERLRIGAAMLMPYFRLPRASEQEAAHKLRPDSDKFDCQTKEALKYYDEFEIVQKLDSLLLLGQQQRDVTSEIYARGGKQYQHFHVILLVAAAAGMRFLCDNSLGQGLLQWRLRFDSYNGVEGGYQTMVLSELGLSPEADDLQTMFRFSLVVSQYMQHHFLDRVGSESLSDRLNRMREVYQTCQQECRPPENDPGAKLPQPKRKLLGGYSAGLSDAQLEDGYQKPIRSAAEFCRAFIRFYFDCAASGYDWSQYHTWNARDERGNPVPGGKTEDHLAGMGARFVDLVNLVLADRCIDGELSSREVSEQELAPYFNFACLDSGRHVEVQFPKYTMARLYDDNMKRALDPQNDLGKSLSQIYVACYNAARTNQEVAR